MVIFLPLAIQIEVTNTQVDLYINLINFHKPIGRFCYYPKFLNGETEVQRK
jgi:hypothetical protein